MKVLKKVSVTFVVILLTYLGASFVVWEFNPEMWTVFARCATIMVASMVSSVLWTS